MLIGLDIDRDICGRKSMPSLANFLLDHKSGSRRSSLATFTVALTSFVGMVIASNMACRRTPAMADRLATTSWQHRRNGDRSS